MSKLIPPSSANPSVSFTELPAVPWERVERFVGQFVHDIRNGLNAIELQLTFLGEISTDPEAIAEIKQLRGTLAEVTRQLQAVKLKTGSSTVHLLDYPMGDFFEDLRERFEELHPAAAGRVRWNIAGKGNLPLDPELGIAALLELLGNALQFSPADGQITVEALLAADGSGTGVTVRQPLAGPPATPPEKWGVSPLLSTKRGAYGLGLFRARRILEAQGAAFQANATDGKSAEISIHFPASGPVAG